MASNLFIPIHCGWINYEEPLEHNIFQELCLVASAMTVGVLTDNQTVWDFVVKHLQSGDGMGSIQVSW
ncbi:hypothetical protein PDIG_88750 [Penicillium digitatum PHI26]|uniref:Uncharacterized protein n=2 Tax=Penicillium digitatum TaxID=36651 RepID=K9F675_PEND2|nr:hypothetical protein PDIP_32060 [Penicillium digitatum Pd1]EKV04559.1 hypothetical protein PDIG_88750 [Penicillium digitatum PHI26]EKV17329.1 hypothetical protein PDIP_32060 [Penicillium digitatum Pd1]